jgi:hypothetical protein
VALRGEASFCFDFLLLFYQEKSIKEKVNARPARGQRMPCRGTSDK